MAEDLNHYVPNHLDYKGKFLMFDEDMSMVALILLMIGMWVNHPLIGLGVGIFLAYQYNKMKAGAHPGYTIHLFYWVTGSPPMKDLPASHDRIFYG